MLAATALLAATVANASAATDITAITDKVTEGLTAATALMAVGLGVTGFFVVWRIVRRGAGNIK